MARSSLTERFTAYKLDQFESKHNRSIMSLFEDGVSGVSIIELIVLGNRKMEREQAATKLDDYLTADEEHSLLSAYFDLMSDFDRDTKMLKSCGLNIQELAKQAMEEARKQAKDKMQVTFKETTAEVAEG